MRVKGYVIGVVAIVVLSLVAGSGWTKELKKVEKGAYYVVKKGDTLWAISQSFYGNPLYWPILWETNAKEVVNPHWIYPGERIYIPHPSEMAALVKTPKPEKKKIVKKKKPILSRELVLFAGYISPHPISSPYTLGTSVYDADKTIFNQLEQVTLFWNSNAAPPKVGEKFMVVRNGDKVKVPGTKRVLGWEILNLGIVEVERVGEDRAQGVVETVAFSVHKDDLLVPLQVPPPIYSLAASPEGKEGVIVRLQENKDAGGLMDFLYVSLGKKDGLKPGMVLNVYSPEGVNQVVGKLVVLRVTESAATCYLWTSAMPLKPGMVVKGGAL